MDFYFCKNKNYNYDVKGKQGAVTKDILKYPQKTKFTINNPNDQVCIQVIGEHDPDKNKKWKCEYNPSGPSVTVTIGG